MNAAAPHIVDRRAADRALTHFNHAGSGLPSAASVMAISQHLLDEMQLTPMEAGARASDRIERGYTFAASLFGCSRDEIAFGTGHGQLYGDLIAAIPFKPGDRILVSRQEWVGNLIALKRRAEATGAVIEVMPSDETTAVDVKAVAAMIDRRVRLVALTWIGASGALINPAAELGKVLAASDALYVIDASQALGQLPIDVKALGCDALIGCGRKYLRGPRGTGIAYVKSSLASRLRPGSVDDFSASWSGGQPELRAGARVLETAEFSVALRLGLIPRSLG
jgi:cysteine desulfurase / selenocysteine lyase